MSTKKLSNISVSDYRKYLKNTCGCKCTRTAGGHEHWTRSNLDRPLTFQSHKDIVPEFIIKNHLKILNKSKEDFLSEFFI